jgi:prepilin-type N-terminal cleavage/methylation domain-containing protein
MKKEKFSLIELLIGVAIVCVLSSFILPTFEMTRHKTLSSAYQNKANKINTTYFTYSVQHNSSTTQSDRNNNYGTKTLCQKNISPNQKVLKFKNNPSPYKYLRDTILVDYYTNNYFKNYHLSHMDDKSSKSGSQLFKIGKQKTPRNSGYLKLNFIGLNYV